ncbi:MAG: hypothetical protein S4CHLAM81_14140 [Chlamydiales bacterium]|nr:hypothetical protein [Chlamydiales bacterium]MCH9636186.1 hypothetical protein [Chlamydiales bacterium]MCH9704224.1 metallophosphoesterase [Chlamydiota bacterium]
MKLFALADLHLSHGVPNKKMDVFGPNWTNYMERIESNWKAAVSDEDLVLLPGDISWALKLEEAQADFDFLEQLPGTKVMIRGNHDYWWSSASKVRAALPPSLHIIQNDVFNIQDFSIAGCRFWDSPELDFSHLYTGNFVPPPIEERLYKRELGRLEMSLKQLDQKAKYRLAMTHYPPIGTDLGPSEASLLFEKYRVDLVAFGHLHALNETGELFGTARGVRYLFVAADHVDCKPVEITF